MSSHKKIEALLFDLGGVLIDIDFENALQAWSQWTPLTIAEMRHRFKMDEAYKHHERGEIEAAQYFNHLRHSLGLEASDAEIALGWNAIFLGEITETIDYVLAVKDKLPCYVLTNTNPSHQTYWMSAYPSVVDLFRHIFVSSEIGSRKPEHQVFEVIEATTGIERSAMLFFNDSEENVLGAESFGMPAIHVKEHSDVKKALSEIGAF